MSDKWIGRRVSSVLSPETPTVKATAVCSVTVGVTLALAVAGGQGLGARSDKEANMTAGSGQLSKTQTAPDLVKTTVAYIEAVGRKDLNRVSTFLDPGLEFTTPGGKDIHGAEAYLAAIKKLSPILVRNDVKTTFVSGNEVCVIYDFVTDTAAGAVPSVEWLTFRNRKITSVRLIFHSKPWPIVLEDLARRSSAP